MPRPPTKRNRLASKAPSAPTKNIAHSQVSSTSREQVDSADAFRPPSRERPEADNASQPGENASVSGIRRQLKSQTPIGKAHAQAIDSSPMGERIATGSRPPTRARGYSSTLSLVGRKGDMSSKIPGTPAFESSILSNFRRRPRQPSILQMMQAEDGSSDLDDDDFLGGLSPEDESTPLNLSRGKSILTRHPPSSPSESSLPSSGGSRKRRRAIEELQVPNSLLEAVENTPASSPVPEGRGGDVADSTDLPLPLESPEVCSQTMAPPMSSSMPPSPAHTVSALNRDNPPSATTELLRRPAKDAPDDVIQFSTAILQDKLLPRRRQRQRKHRDAVGTDVPKESERDYPSSEQDDDELSYLPAGKPAQSRRKQTAKSKSSNARVKSKPAGEQRQKKGRTKNDHSARTDDGNRRPIPIARPLKQTYTRPQPDVSIDKANQPVDLSSPLSSPLDSDAFESDASLSDSGPATNFLSEELKSQAMKFAEVDKWQMEFEDVITSGSQGSSCR
ncbi:hypothetical protein ASPWEDRAFT_175101 [Aspergillus wentii DTO 134E9]|uniref:Uncharacterized protein n=1 Tax=Aspergillus wentii DTO 134E9 TaxID=1073089 RepID=A0A1L9RA57_ASPWE|nr:uncharacterized protein ASPWEDRAFT_175101 [Aspergillus wentii DTO 134E9]KAI9927342.1 hypothetical protein MW887_002954 [Aspergillus wentii]OJJ31778.1 hypothetical protein ASPWEDRAFT_175101 [Aspergillus wentii DTO 134E9]